MHSTRGVPDALPLPITPPAASTSTPSNGKHSRKQWWEHLPIPDSWHAGDERERERERDHYRDRDRDPRESLDLDDTRSRLPSRRYDDPPPAPPPFPPQPRIQIPLGVVVSLVIYLIGQLIGGIWWAATMQSTQQHEISDRAKEEARLWDNVQTYRLEVQQLRVEIARNQTQIRHIKEDQQDN